MALSGFQPAPVEDLQRIDALDIIRALALFGVLQMNLIWFSGDIYLGFQHVKVAAGWAGPAFAWVRNTLLASKAMTVYSLLFGIGLTLQMERAQAAGRSFTRFGVRRMTVLAAIGFCHGMGFWIGDILLGYALIGLLVLPWLKATPRTLLLLAGGTFLLTRATEVLVLPHLPRALNFMAYAQPWMGKAADHAYGHGSFLEILRFHGWEYAHLGLPVAMISILNCLPTFLLGAALARTGRLRDLEGSAPYFRRIFHGCFWVGLVLEGGGEFLVQKLQPSWMGGWRAAMLTLVFGCGMLSLALGYFSGLLLLLRKPLWKIRLQTLAPLGRMALTNYLTHTLVWTWIFYHHGLGLWQQVSRGTYFLMGLGLYAAQLAFSHWWLGRFRFGPMEWVWRSLTYGKAQPMAQVRPVGDLAAEAEA